MKYKPLLKCKSVIKGTQGNTKEGQIIRETCLYIKFVKRTHPIQFDNLINVLIYHFL